MTNDDEPTKDELEQRVEQLEQTVQRMMPNRRQALTGLGLLAGGGLLGGSASGSTGSAGNVGTQSDRPDVFADSVDSNSVSTEKGTIGTIWSGNLSNDPANPDYITFSDEGDSTSPITSIMSVGTTVTADNSATDLIELNNGDARLDSGQITVVSRLQGSTDVRTDVIRQALATSRDVTTTTRDNPGPTSYSRDGSMLQIAIDDNGNDYDVSLIGLGAWTE